jgi:predicted alpha/beta hydrolase family esterase
MIGRKIVIVPCFEENPFSHWYQWLAARLRHAGEIVVLDMPRPRQPRLPEWVGMLGKRIGDPSSTTVIGHSIGGNTALHYAGSLAASGRELGGLILVATARSYSHDALQSFDCHGLNFSAIRQAVRNMLLVSSPNDPHIPLNESKELHQALSTPMMVVHQDGHLGRTAEGHPTPNLADPVMWAIQDFFSGRAGDGRSLARGDAVFANGSLTYNGSLGL